jgi:uncharacterized RDD family membrane protein YckC
VASPPPPPLAVASPPPPPPAASNPTPAGYDPELAELLARIDEDGDINAPAIGTELTKPTDVARPERAAAALLESEGGIDFDPVLASFGARAVGLLVDLVILTVLLVPGIALIAAGSTPLILLGLALIVAGFAVGTVLYTRAITSTGQSVGNRVAGTKVVDARNGRPVESGEAGLRYILRFTVSIIFFIGFLVAFADPQRRTFHDKIAGTVVTRPARASWSIDDEVATPPRA